MADTSLIFNILARDRNATKTLNRVADGVENVNDQLTETNSSLRRMTRAMSFAEIRGHSMAAVIGAAIGALPLAANAAAGGIVLALGGALATVGIAAAAQSKRVQKTWKNTIDRIKSQVTTMATPFEGVLIRIAGMFERTFNKFAPTMAVAFQRLAPAIETFAGHLFNAFLRLQPAIAPIVTAFNKILRRLGPRLPAIFSGISSGVIAVANAISGNTGAFVRLVVIIGKVITWGLKLVALLTRYPGIAAGVIVVLGVLAAAFAPIPIAVAGVIAILTALASWVALRFPQIKAWIINAWQAVTGFTSRAWDRIKVAVAAGIARVLGLVTALPSRVLGAIGNLGSLLWNAGWSLIQGLINGIQSAVGGLQSTLSWVSGLIPDWKGPLSEDRRLLQPAGKVIMSGLIGGIEGETRALRSTLAGVSSTIGRGLAPPPVAPAGTPAAQQGGPATVRLVVDGTDSDLKKLIRKMVRVDGRGDVQVTFGNG